MLSRKAEMQLVVGPTDRGRVAERLRAALAGLHELHVLRQKQGDMVQGALRTDNEHPDNSEDLDLTEGTTNTEEQLRLEATLNALKHQLTRLRRQDIGLKTHLKQLDQQINELRLDGWKASTEHIESDSRPSSGFFELSDGGLGSLSNSCTSVYSECLSSSSQVSLLPQTSGPSVPLSRSTLWQTDVSRRRSADEATAQPDVPRGLGVRLGIRTGSISSERARQRPVSTGDLDRVMNPVFGSCKPTEVKTSTLNRKLCDPTVDPKYQSNLVSRSGTEVYCYPSPLHAVALQSPIFSLSEDLTAPMVSKLQGKQIAVGLTTDTLRKQEPSNLRPDGYIVKLLHRSSSKMSLQSDIGADIKQMSSKDNQVTVVTGFRNKQMNSGVVDGSNVHGLLQQKPTSFENLCEVENLPKIQSDQESIIVNCIKKEDSAQMWHGQSSAGDCYHKQAVVLGVHSKVQKPEEKEPGIYAEQNKDATVVLNQPEKGPTFRYANEESRSGGGDPVHTTQSEFVCAQFVPAGSQRVKVRQADKKHKSVKLRKRGNEKLPSKKHQQRHSYREQDKTKGCSYKNRGERDSKIIKEREMINGHLIEPRLHSCSESSLSGPQNPCGSQYQLYRQPKHSNKSNKAQFVDQENPFPLQAKKKQWPYVTDILPPAVPGHYQRSKDAGIHKVIQKPAMIRSVSMRPRTGHWGGHARPLPPSLSYSSYFSNMELKYPPAPLSTRYPPKCESEYSAECASLFHSTIVESSEGELSDYTTNRFGDSESSQGSQTASDSDSSLSLDEDDLLEEDEDEGGLVWPEAAMGPTAAGHHRPEPAACRIKASRALKKKIRRFQPASLKVMTLV